MTDKRTDYYSEILSKMVAIDTVSVFGQTDLNKFTVFQDRLKQFFPGVFSVCSVELFGTSFLLRWKGKDSNRRVIFMNHQDVVPCSGEWKYPPFTETIAEDKVWGRGTLDDKGGLFAMLQAAEELISDGFIPAIDIYFVSGCDEEVSGEGSCSIAKELQKRNLRFDWVLDEGGMIVNEPIPGAKGYFAMVGLAEKGSVDLKITAHSEGGHASMPPKNSPLVRLGRFMDYCDRKRIFEVKLSPVIQKMFKKLSKKMIGVMKILLGHPCLFRGLLEYLIPKVSPVAAAMVKTTLAFTQCEGSNAANVLPLEAWVMGNMRTSLHQGIKSSIEVVKKAAAKFNLEVEVIDPGFQSNMASTECKGYQIIERSVSKCFPSVEGTVPYVQTSASDSRFMSLVSDNCYRFVPFIIDDQQLGSIHSVNECVDVSNLAPAVDFYKYLMEEC